MAVVIAITNQKGGVGKTTTCAAFCGGLTESGKSVLAIDLDPQGNLSFSLGADAEESYTMYDVFKGNCTVKEEYNARITAMLSPQTYCCRAVSLSLPVLAESTFSERRCRTLWTIMIT